MITAEEVFPIGRIGKVHGIRGEVSFHFDDDVFDRVEADYLVIETDGILVPFFMEEYRFRSDETAIVKFDGIDTETQARALTGCAVYFPYALAGEDEEPPLTSGIIGFTVTDARTSALVGTVTGIDSATVNTLLEVAAPDGREVLIPVVEEWIEAVDRDRRAVTMRLPEGLLDLDKQV